MDLRRDPAFVIASPKWDTFSAWEWRPERRASYLGDVDWDRQLAPEASLDDDDDEEEDEDEGGVGVQAEQPPPPPPRVTGEVSGQIYNGRVVCDDTDDMVGHVVYHYLRAAELGQHFDIPPELTEEQLAVAVIVSAEEKRAFPGIDNALALSVAPPPPPGPSPLQPPPRPRAMPGWSPGTRGLEPCLPVIGWAPRTPPPPLGPPPPPMAEWPWPQAPFIDLSGDDGDGQA
jgi:hypothetical protein